MDNCPRCGFDSVLSKTICHSSKNPINVTNPDLWCCVNCQTVFLKDEPIREETKKLVSVQDTVNIMVFRQAMREMNKAHPEITQLHQLMKTKKKLAEVIVCPSCKSTSDMSVEGETKDAFGMCFHCTEPFIFVDGKAVPISPDEFVALPVEVRANIRKDQDIIRRLHAKTGYAQMVRDSKLQ